MSGEDDLWRRHAAVHASILAQMGDGVVTIDLAGRVITFNPAAGAILGLEPASVLDRPFAETFLTDVRFDAFCELTLRAIYDAETTHSELIELSGAGEPRSLSVSTTFLREDDGSKIGVIIVLRDITSERKRKRLKRLFGEYLDPRIVQRLIDRTEDLEQGARTLTTVLFVDLEGFTRLGERLSAHQLLAFLNRYLAEMSQPIGHHSGVTDKYIGDAVMAFWGPPFTEAGRDAVEACAAALDQRARLPHLRQVLAAETGLDDSTLDCRAGLATGEAVVGSLGPANARNFTVIGDTVNLAARLETANKELGTRILVSDATRSSAEAEFAFRPIDLVRVRNRERPEPVHELLAERAALTEAQARLAERYAQALAAYQARDWPAARSKLGACLELAPDDAPSRRLAAHVARLAQEPPHADWDGAWPP